MIKVKPWGQGQGDFVLIEDEDFNPEFHTLFEEPKPKEEPKKPKDSK